MMNESTISSFCDELIKIAGIRDALRTALTGRVPLFHGTSAARAAAIKAKGLVPQGAKGISSKLGLDGLEQGTAFTTRSRADASNYALQQVGMDRLDRLKGFFTRHNLPGSSQLSQLEGPMAVNPARALGALPGGGKSIVRANVPRGVIQEAPSQELSRMKANVGPALDKIHPRLGQVTALPFTSHVPVQGGVPSKYIVGSSDYARTSFGEVKDNLRSAVQNPRAYGKDVLRSLVGEQHRPSTLWNRTG